MDKAPSDKVPLKVAAAYWLFVPAVLAQYFLYWAIGMARRFEVIEAQTMSILENKVFYAAPIIVLLELFLVWHIAESTQDVRHRSNARAAYIIALVTLLPQIVVTFLTLVGFKDS